LEAVTISLQKLGIEKPSWKTVIPAASQDVEIPQGILWDTWSKLEEWPAWSKPFHLATRWVGTSGWEVGAQFEQDLNLGFPLGKITSAETVGAVVPRQSVMWWKEERGVRSCHRWEFESLSESQTRITNVEVFHGTAIGLVKPFVARKWQHMFEQAVAGLIQQAQRNLMTATSSTA
jgi:hypothetical protein